MATHIFDTVKKHHERNKKRAGRVFKSDFLERFARTHFSIPVSILMAYGIGLFYWAVARTDLNALTIIGLALLGAISLTLTEYLVHRFLFHMHADESEPRKLRFRYIIHGIHHDYPIDKYRLALPPIITVTIALFLLLSLQFLIGDYTFPWLGAYALTYVGYVSIHYTIHAFPPPNNRFRILWTHHAIHHYQDPTRAFGISSPLWDYVFRTMPRATKTSKQGAEQRD